MIGRCGECRLGLGTHDPTDPLCDHRRDLPIHRTEAGYPRCSTCEGGGCLDCTDPA